MAVPLKLVVSREVPDPSLFNTAHRIEPEPGAELSMVRRTEAANHRWPFDTLPATHAGGAKGYYQVISGPEPDEGDWLLVVAMEGCSPIIQRLTLVEKDGALRAYAGWDGDAAPSKQLQSMLAVVSIANIDQLSGGQRSTQPRQAVVKATLLPRTELVLMNGYEYYLPRRNVRFDRMPESRRDTLYRKLNERAKPVHPATVEVVNPEKALNKATIVTHIDAWHRRRYVYAKAADKSAIVWVTTHQEQAFPLPQPGETRPNINPVKNEYSILALYEHLDGVGKQHPGTVIEASVFSHGYLGGPSLFNTYDHSPSYVDRDPRDLDGRAKDFLEQHGKIAESYPSLPKAFRADGSVRVWGCQHDNRLVMAARAALPLLKPDKDDKLFPRDVCFWVKSSVSDHGVRCHEHLTLDHLRQMLVVQARGTRVSRHELPKESGEQVVSYAGLAAQRDIARVFAAAPGMGATVLTAPSFLGMCVDLTSPGKTRDGIWIPPENRDVLAYLELEFGDRVRLNEYNYLDYSTFRLAEPVDPGWHTDRSLLSNYEPCGEKGPRCSLRLPSGMAIRAPTYRVFERPTAYTANGLKGHLYPAPRYVIDVVQVCDAIVEVQMRRSLGTRSTAFFVTEGGGTIVLTRGTDADPWARETEPIGIWKATYNEGKWQPAPQPARIVTHGLIEQVQPQWYW